MARLIGAKLQTNLGQSVIVENRPGAGGTLGARDVANATPDGYMLTVAQTPEIAINPFFMKGAGYDPLKDLQPVALAGVVPLALVVRRIRALFDHGGFREIHAHAASRSPSRPPASARRVISPANI